MRFDFEKPFQWWGEGREGGRGEREKKRLSVKEGEKEKRLKYSLRKAKGRRRETRQGLTRSNWQQCFRQFGSLLSLYFYKESRNTSSAIHFISIQTPASHLHSVSFASPFHFSACHYISWMITYWQFLHRQSTDRDTTPAASRAGENGEPFFFPPPNLAVFSLSSSLHPKSQSSSQISTSTPPPPLPKNLDQIQIFAMWPLWDLAWPGDSLGTLGRIVCLASPQQQMNQALNSSPD